MPLTFQYPHTHTVTHLPFFLPFMNTHMHTGAIFLHCIPPSRSYLDDPPSISEGWGGRITDYRISVSTLSLEVPTIIPLTLTSFKYSTQVLCTYNLVLSICHSCQGTSLTYEYFVKNASSYMYTTSRVVSNQDPLQPSADSLEPRPPPTLCW